MVASLRRVARRFFRASPLAGDRENLFIVAPFAGLKQGRFVSTREIGVMN
jgi:hypothetical protein